MSWKTKSFFFLFLLSPACLSKIFIRNYTYKTNKKYVEFELVIFRRQSATFYNSTTNYLTDAIVSLREHMFGEIKVGRSDTYEKVVSVANPRCAPENNNPFTSFMDKVVHGDLQKYVTNNVTICPFRKGVVQINNFPVLSDSIPNVLANVKFHGSMRTVLKLKGIKKPVEANRIDVYGETYN